MDNAYTIDTFKEKILGKQPGMKAKLEILEKTLHVQSQPAARQSALAEFLKREVSLKQAGDRTVFAWRRPDGAECTLELGQDGDFDFFGPDDPESPAAPAAARGLEATESPTAAPAEESDEEETEDQGVEETETDEGDEADETDENEDEESEESENAERDRDAEADDAEADSDEAGFTPGALFTTIAASLGKGATAVLTIARDGDNLVVTFTPHSAGDAAEHDRAIAVTAPAAELDHPTEGFVTLIGATAQARKTLAEVQKEYEAAVKAEADAKKAEADTKKKAANKKTSAAKAKTESDTTETAAEAEPKAEVKNDPKTQEAPLFG